MDRSVLIVCNHRRWVAEDLAAGAASRKIRVVHSLGLGVPPVPGPAICGWWTPTEHAARLARAGVVLSLVAPGPRLMSRLPEQLTRRSVWSGTVADLPRILAEGRIGRSGFAKLAEAKHPRIPAAWYDDLAAFVGLTTGLLPSGSVVQVADRKLAFMAEHRLFVAHGMIVAESPYLIGDGTTWHEGMRSHPDVDTPGALAAGRRFMVALATAGLLPPSCTLDVGLLPDRTWAVVELNPTFSSAFYGADTAGVVTALLAAYDRPSAHSRWAWEPDPWLVLRAAQQPVLPQD